MGDLNAYTKTFFRNCWNEAFQENVDESEYLKVEQIFEVYAKTITPREIIAFINEIVSIKLLHCAIPERYIGLFVINKDQILVDPLKAIISSEFLQGLSYLYKDDEDFQKYITALSYQIAPENALEVVYRKQLKDCLVNNDETVFSEISKTNVFNKIVFSVITELGDFDKPIQTINSLKEDSNLNETERQNVWDNIYLKFKIQFSNSTFVPDFELKESYQILLLQISNKHKQDWVKSIIDKFSAHSLFDSVVYAKIIDELDSIDKKESFGIDVFKQLKLKNVNVDNFISIVKNKKDNYNKYKIQTEKKDLDKYFSELEIDKLKDIDYITHLPSDYIFTAFEKSLKEKINASKANNNNLSVLFNALKYISKDSINGLLNDNEIFTLFTQSNANEDFYYDLVAMRLAKGAGFTQQFQPYFAAILNTSDDSIVEKVAKQIEYYITPKIRKLFTCTPK
ncbi:hypothetical protein FACS1894195_5290 [Bacteroidia bacterium]|nr:hypothetical protein FACS1894195_5290 [Bacteroidia bacterium]